MKRLVFLLAACGLAAAPASAWGPIGHRVTAQIAQDNVSGHTRARIEQILGHEQLPEASTWPDEQQSNPAEFWQTTSKPWHYVTLPVGHRAEALEHPPEGDAETALSAFAATLRDPAASREQKQLALRFIVHIVGDLHQPLHVGKPGDRGGNEVKVKWFGNPAVRNLHWVWDSGIIEGKYLSFTEYTARLKARITPAQTVAWWDAQPDTWMNESAALRDRIYPQPSERGGAGTAEAPFVLGYDYSYEWTPDLELRLQQGGIRLAAYLDEVFAPES